MEESESSKLSESGENRPKISRLWWQSIVATAPLALALGYIVTYLYELGYSNSFGIPREFITIAMTNIFIGVSKAFLSGLALFWLLFIVLVPRQKMGPILRRLFLLAFSVIIFVLFAIIYPRAWNEWYFMAPLFLFFAFEFFIAPFLSQGETSGYRNKLLAQDKINAQTNILNYLEKYLGRTGVGVLLFILPLIGMPYFSGEAEAVEQTTFWVPSTNQNSVVLRIYDDNLICAELDDEGTRLNGRFFVLKVDSDPILYLQKQYIGNLASYR